jgi:glutathione S-transferase
VGEAIKLFGTLTSPYTRKIRILAAAARLDVELIDTRTDAGAVALSSASPLAKVPVIEVDGTVIPDSAVIIGWLWARHGDALRVAGFRVDPADLDDRVSTVIADGALDAAINRFYLRRDGFDDRGYVGRQGDRVEAALLWLEARITFGRPITGVRLALGCALDWMVFRHMVDLGRYPKLSVFREAWADSGVGAGTQPEPA